MKTILVTGVAGFIGSHTAKKLLERGDKVIGIDNINEYYDPVLKQNRLDVFFKDNENFIFYKEDISDLKAMEKIFSKHKIDQICHLAAQAGVRYSLTDPYAYLKSNIDGTIVLFEMARKFGIKTVVYASSSSVYGDNEKQPFSEKDRTDNPISLYAATKKSNELMAYNYHKLFGINMTGLRFFTVYGEYGRPDMALFLFTDAILKGNEMQVFNHGKMKRDFTYISDIVFGIISSLDKEYKYEIFNLGCGKRVELMKFISLIEKELGIIGKKKFMDMQPGDVPESLADVSYAKEKLGYEPKVNVEEGVKKFIKWYKEYYNV
jgi:UDP-glucuronate 4-epimerase